MVHHLLEEETKRFRPSKKYLENLPPPNDSAFVTPIMKKEFERIAANQPMDLLSMKRYELPPPPVTQRNDPHAWKECVDNSSAQLEHQAVRIINLQLLTKYGSNSWRVYIELLNEMLTNQRKEVQGLTRKIQEINWQRKNEQTNCGSELANLEASWFAMVRKNYDIEQACLELEAQIDASSKEMGTSAQNGNNVNIQEES
ncbi:Pre-mRNA-splicing factor SPF27 [Trichoplax sp. H2]|nr:Pre-mRNA-splicing factor SPF27 [Trichoplax sp. H2]|eukprot:RDD45803.1 Pre-mRNA-splicing factor SPF27 [Trichoplax sp. H2]